MPISPPRHRAASSRPYARPQKTTDPIYGTKDWKITRQIVLERDGRQCRDETCKTPNRGLGGYLEVDHIIELSDGGDPFDPANCLTRCRTCHRRKTALEAMKRRR